MLRAADRSRRGAPARLHGARWLFAALLAMAAPAAAQSFTPPKECKHGASGSEGDDPVVLVVDRDANQYLIAPVNLVTSTPPIQWSVTISPFRNTIAGYQVFTTYTPFLTSDTAVSGPSVLPKYELILPQPGVTGGRYTAVYDIYNLTVINLQTKAPIPFAIVDFIPDFIGSSPLTIQANGNGVISLYCVQQNFQGYNITVHDSQGNYLYDGSFAASGSLGTSAPHRTPHRTKAK